MEEYKKRDQNQIVNFNGTTIETVEGNDLLTVRYGGGSIDETFEGTFVFEKAHFLPIWIGRGNRIITEFTIKLTKEHKIGESGTLKIGEYVVFNHEFLREVTNNSKIIREEGDQAIINFYKLKQEPIEVPSLDEYLKIIDSYNKKIIQLEEDNRQWQQSSMYLRGLLFKHNIVY